MQHLVKHPGCGGMWLVVIVGERHSGPGRHAGGENGIFAPYVFFSVTRACIMADHSFVWWRGAMLLWLASECTAVRISFPGRAMHVAVQKRACEMKVHMCVPVLE